MNHGNLTNIPAIQIDRQEYSNFDSEMQYDIEADHTKKKETKYASITRKEDNCSVHPLNEFHIG